MDLNQITTAAEKELSTLIKGIIEFTFHGVTHYNDGTWITFRFKTVIYEGTFSYTLSKGKRNTLNIHESFTKE